MDNNIHKKKNVFHRPSLARDYIVIVSLVTSLTILLIISFSFYIYNSHQKEKNNATVIAANRIERSLTESFDYVSHLMTFFGQEIQKLDTLDSAHITKLLRGELASDKIIKNLFSWTLFDWIDKNNKMTVSTTLGKIDKVIDMSFRSYTRYTPKQPWKLHFSQPAVGVPSGQWVIPAAMGVTDKSGNYIGAIGMGFNILKLTRKIEQDLLSQNIRFLVLTSEFNIISMSADNEIDRKSDFYKTNLGKQSILNAKEGFLPNPITQGNTTFTYYKRIENVPYIILIGYSSVVGDDIFYRIFYPVVTGFILLGLLFIGMSIAMHKWLVDPVVELAAAAEKISNVSSSGKKIYIPRPKTKELQTLARQLLRVQYLINRLQGNSIALAIAKTAAESANIAKTEFLSSTAHELRSPLNAIIGMSEVIKTKMFGEELDSYIEYAGDIEQSGHELLEFITDLLDITKSETGSFALDNQEMLDIGNIINRAVKLNISRANKANIRIDVHIEEGLPKLYADGRRIRQILVNLISNSIKYSPPGTMVNISAIMRDGKMALIIADQGFGMNEQQLAIALQKWGKVENANSGKVESVGLGLPLAKHLAELHGAEFLIDSEPGNGTIITMVFPEDGFLKESSTLLF